jgi:hypothetical protein
MVGAQLHMISTIAPREPKKSFSRSVSVHCHRKEASSVDDSLECSGILVVAYRENSADRHFYLQYAGCCFRWGVCMGKYIAAIYNFNLTLKIGQR